MYRIRKINFKILYIPLLLVFFGVVPSSVSQVFALDTLTQSEMETIGGQAGMSIGFGDAITVQISFDAFAYGTAESDPSEDGWLIIDGANSTTATITNRIEAGSKFELDISQTGASAYTTNDVTIPANTIFAYGPSLPTISPAIDLPDTMTIGLGNTQGSIAKTFGQAKIVGLEAKAVSIDSGYLWVEDFPD